MASQGLGFFQGGGKQITFFFLVTSWQPDFLPEIDVKGMFPLEPKRLRAPLALLCIVLALLSVASLGRYVWFCALSVLACLLCLIFGHLVFGHFAHTHGGAEKERKLFQQGQLLPDAHVSGIG